MHRKKFEPMKEFKDYTIEDFANFDHIHTEKHKVAARTHFVSFSRATKTPIPVPRVIHRVGELTEELLTVPTVNRPQ